VLAALSADARSALEVIGAADPLRESIGTPRALSLEQEIATRLDLAAAGMSDHEGVALRARTLARLVDCSGQGASLCEQEPAIARPD
jgi:hypothetical protein